MGKRFDELCQTVGMPLAIGVNIRMYPGAMDKFILGYPLAQSIIRHGQKRKEPDLYRPAVLHASCSYRDDCDRTALGHEEKWPVRKNTRIAR